MEKLNNIVPYSVITPAVEGDVNAMNCVINHFEGYLIQLSRKTLFDSEGNSYGYVDPEIKRRLEMKLMSAILKFENIV